jgi:lipopolysaccharide biosynthesis glycosyltransferase
MTDKRKIFIGAQPSHGILVKVLSHSIKKYASCKVSVVPLHKARRANHRMPSDDFNFPGTSFSFFRFLIPEEASFEGNALYLDSDMIVFSDIKKLFDTDMEDNDVMVADHFKDTGHSSVMLINCDKCKWDIDSILNDLDSCKYYYPELMRLSPVADSIGYFSSDWNCLDNYNKDTKLLHYTSMPSQPWLNWNNPNGVYWFRALSAAIDAGVVTGLDIETAISNRHIRPSILEQLRSGEEDSTKLSKEIISKDEEFIQFCRENGWNNMEGNYRNSYNKEAAADIKTLIDIDNMIKGK